MRHVTQYTSHVIKAFADKRTHELFTTGKARRFPPDIARRAVRKLEYVDLATRLDDLKTPPGNRLHSLAKDRKGQYSISINEQMARLLPTHRRRRIRCGDRRLPLR